MDEVVEFKEKQKGQSVKKWLDWVVKSVREGVKIKSQIEMSFGHVQRMGEESIPKRVQEMHPFGKTYRGCP